MFCITCLLFAKWCANLIVNKVSYLNIMLITCISIEEELMSCKNWSREKGGKINKEKYYIDHTFC